jgi:hypothetical protein
VDNSELFGYDEDDAVDSEGHLPVVTCHNILLPLFSLCTDNLKLHNHLDSSAEGSFTEYGFILRHPSLLTRHRSKGCGLAIAELICLLLSTRIGDAIAMARTLAGQILLPVKMDGVCSVGDMSGYRQCHDAGAHCRITASNGCDVLSWL